MHGQVLGFMIHSYTIKRRALKLHGYLVPLGADIHAYALDLVTR